MIIEYRILNVPSSGAPRACAAALHEPAFPDSLSRHLHRARQVQSGSPAPDRASTSGGSFPSADQDTTHLVVSHAAARAAFAGISPSFHTSPHIIQRRPLSHKRVAATRCKRRV